MAETELMDHDWVSVFEDLHIPNSRICDVGMYSVGSVPIGTRPGSAGDGLDEGN